MQWICLDFGLVQGEHLQIRETIPICVTVAHDLISAKLLEIKATSVDVPLAGKIE